MNSLQKIALLISLACFSLGATAQQKNFLALGASFSIPCSIPYGSNKAEGYGIQLKGERLFSRHLSGNFSLGYTYFKGDISFFGAVEETSFALVPVTVGARYYINKFYLGTDFGFAIKASSNAGTNVIVAPSLGIVMKKWDAGIKLTGIPQTYNGLLEDNYLTRGGYSYLGVYLNYIFHK